MKYGFAWFQQLSIRVLSEWFPWWIGFVFQNRGAQVNVQESTHFCNAYGPGKRLFTRLFQPFSYRWKPLWALVWMGVSSDAVDCPYSNGICGFWNESFRKPRCTSMRHSGQSQPTGSVHDAWWSLTWSGFDRVFRATPENGARFLLQWYYGGIKHLVID